MSPFSFYLGGSPTTFIVYLVLWIILFGYLILGNPPKIIQGKLKAFILLALSALLIVSVTFKVGHRQADLHREQFDTPTLTNQKEVVQSSRTTRDDASKSLETQIEKQRKENEK